MASDRLSEVQMNEDASLWPEAHHFHDLRQSLKIKPSCNRCCADFTAPVLPSWGVWSCWIGTTQSGGRAVYWARLLACTNKLWVSKSLSLGSQMNFDMEMASVQIDRLCRLNNQINAWTLNGWRATAPLSYYDTKRSSLHPPPPLWFIW